MLCDESQLRAAASWQDFKEAKSLLPFVTHATETSNGWSGTVQSGKRSFKSSVLIKSPIHLETRCSCPANQRDGILCPHAIATALHLLNPPKSNTTHNPSLPASNPTPISSCQIQIQGPWLKTLLKSHLALSLTQNNKPPSPADERLSTWLTSHNVTLKKSLQIHLNPTLLEDFLTTIDNHPDILTPDGPLTIETDTLIQLENCTLNAQTITLTTKAQTLLSLNNSIWEISPEKLSRIGPGKTHTSLLSTLHSLASKLIAKIPLSTFLLHLDSIQSHLDLSTSEWFNQLQFIPAIPTFHLELTGSLNQLNAHLLLQYPDSPTTPINQNNHPNLPRLQSEQTCLTRNIPAEQHAISLLNKSGFKPTPNHQFILTSETEIISFITQTLPSLPENWIISTSPSISKISSSFALLSPKLEILQAEKDQTFFNLSFQSSDGDNVSSAEIHQILRSKNSNPRLTNGKRAILSDHIEDLITPLFEDLDLQQSNGRFSASNATAEIIEEIRKKITKSLNKNDLKDLLTTYTHLSIRATLRPYQTHGANWLIDRLNRYHGALLADDMGLGKTLQAIACIDHFLSSEESTQHATCLVVVTTSLLGNWLAEIKRFTPHRRVVTLHGNNRDSLRATIRHGDIILTTYATLTRDLAYHLRQTYTLAVIDEASLIRNPDTDHSKAVSKLNATHRIALTGTPVENSARDLWAIFRFIQPSWLGTRSHFKERYEIPLQSPETADRTSQLLRLKTLPFTLRRTKTQVAPELPSKIHIDEYCTLSPDQLTTYRELRKQGQQLADQCHLSGQTAAARMQTLTTLLRLRQACCDLALFDNEKLQQLPIPRRSAKLERLLEIVQSAISSDSRILVFSQFQKQLLAIENTLKTLQIDSLRLDGKTRDRQTLVNQFQAPNGPPVFLISLKAGGYGLNLTAADIVVHFDPWWNPAAEAQATDRAHRIGQTKPVTVFRLLTRDTVEQKVIDLQSSKKNLAESLDESLTPTNAPNLTTQQLQSLLNS